MTPEERREYADMILRDYRGVETPCPDCAGWGVRTYASTACWRGGFGWQAITSGVCDGCWGSGDKSKPWVDLLEVERLRAERDKWHEAWNAMDAAATKFCEDWKRAEAEVVRLSSALDAAARVVARKAARERGSSEKDPTISDGGGA